VLCFLDLTERILPKNPCFFNVFRCATPEVVEVFDDGSVHKKPLLSERFRLIPDEPLNLSNFGTLDKTGIFPAVTDRVLADLL
jgi:hypothetical protein